MNTRPEIVSKIAALKAYSVARNASTAAVIAPLEAAAADYFDGGSAAVSAACEDVVKYMYNDIARRTTIYEHYFDANLPTEYPTGYDDVTECFADFSGIMAVSNAAFYAAFVSATDPETGVSGIVSNTYVDTWVTMLTQAKTGDVAKLNTLAEWCKNSGGSSDVIDLLEDKGNEISSKSREEIAAIIYMDKKLLEVIYARGLSTYVPSYLQGGG